MLKLSILAFLFFAGSNGMVMRDGWFEESYKRFKDSQDNFTTKYHNQFKGWTEDQIKTLMGARLDDNMETKHLHRVHYDLAAEEANIPSSFWCSQKWPNCASTFQYVKDQSACGSCWAVSASSVIAGRICIAHGGLDPKANAQGPGNMFLNERAPPIDFSGAQILSCCSFCGEGCRGGWPIDAMYYATKEGVVTGGWYGSPCGCYPYPIAPCHGGCQEGPTPPCRNYCTNPRYPFLFSSDKHYAYDHYKLKNDEKTLQYEIMNHGPIECAFQVYENFMHYSNGVYTQAQGKFLGGHAVTNYGWGVWNGIKYWIFRNSWNLTWGDQGRFYFRRGVNLCGMESGCVAARFRGTKQSWGLKCEY